MAESPIHEGGCLCGAVRYRATAEPDEVSHCHCEMCRHHGGTVFQTWVTFATGDLTFVEGAPEIYASSDIAERGFCDRCGTPLTFHFHAQPDRTSVTVGSLDRPEAVTPEHHHWGDEEVSWLRLDDGLPRRARD